ncbi:helix turn helix protein [Inoviridae sp.]|nr:helix turn helix protein [Inoviridae sp.]
MSAYDLVEEVKKNANISSDNALGIAIGKTRSTVSSWKQGLAKPDGETTLKLITLGRIEPKRALELMQGGYTRLSLVPVTGLAAIALPYCYNVLKHCILCSISGKYKNQLGFNFGQYKT